MKASLALCLFAAAATAAKLDSKDGAAEVLKYVNEANEDGSYKVAFETSNGISQSENGQQKPLKDDDPGTVASGSYSYVHDGVTYTITYTADENGFVAKGAHLPVAPEAPAYVAELIAKAAAEKKTR